MNGRAVLIGFVAAVAVAVSGIAASDAFAEPEIALELRGSVADSGHRYLDQASDVKVFTYNSRIYAVVAATGEGAHLLDITNPNSIGTLDNGDAGERNVATSSGQMTAIAVYTVGGKPYFIVTWAGSNAIQAYKIAEPGDTDGAGGAISDVGRLVNRPNPLIGSSLAGASDLIIYSVGNKQYAAVTVEGADRLAVVEATDPDNLAAANIAGQIIDSGNLELDGPSGVEYYQTNNRHYAVVVSEADDGMQIVDITNPVSPTAAGYLSDDSSTLLDGAEGVAIYSVSGRTYAVVAATIDDGIQIVDITDPANIFPTGKLGDTGSLRLDRVQDVAIHTIGDRHYAVVTSLQEDGIQVVDVTNPYNPVPKATIGGTTLNGATGVDTFSIGNRHYAVVASDDGDYVQIVEMTAVNADAGDGLSVDAGRTVVLAGSGSVSSGATPTYQWTQTGGTTVTLNAPTALRTTFTAPTTPSTLIFQLAATHGGATSTDIVTVSVAPDAVGSPDKTAVALNLTDSVADSVYTYLRNAVDVKVFEHGGKIYAVVASNSDSIHLLDITDPANIDELRHPNPESQSGGNNHNNAPGAESAVPYVAIDGNLYIMLSWGSSDALQSFYIHSNGRLDELAATVDNIKMNHAADLIIYTLQTRCDSTPGTVLATDDDGHVSACQGPKIIGMAERDRVVVEPGDLVARQYAAVIGQLSHSIRIVDVTDPRDLGKPALRGEITDSTSTLLRGPIDIAHYQTNNRHYAVVAASQEDGIQIVDITNPNSPTAAGHLADTDDLEMRGADGVAVYSVGGRTYAVVTGNSEDGIQIVDITDPHNIFPTGNLADTGMLELDNPRGVVVHRIGDRYYAVVAASHDDGIEAVDVTDPYNPVPKGRVGDTTGAVELDGATGVDTFSIGNRHYVVVASSDDHGVQIAEMAVLTADAGGDRVIPGRTAQIPLDGSASTVSSGDSPTYQWTQTGGPPVTLSTPTIAIPNFAPPAPPQVLSFLLTVSHGNARAVDTVTVTLEGNPSTDVASFGGQIVSETINVVDVPHNNGTAGTSKYISMHFAGEGESQTFTYRLLEAPSGTVTVSFMTLVQTGHDDAVYTWDWNAVSVSPRTLTFTPSNWYTPQVVTLTSQTDGDNTSEQVIIAIVSSAPGSYSGIHVTVDDRPASPGTSGTSGGPIILESAQRPVITLSGPYIMDVQLNSVWTDPGYTATDADGNDITASVTVTGTVDTTTAATYLLYYQVADGSGTPATPQTRTVHVIAPEPQQLTQEPQSQPQQTQEPQPEPEPEQEPEQEPTQEPEQEPEQEPTQEPEQEPEQTQEPEQEPEQEPTQEPEQEPEGTESDQQPTCDIPAIVRQYDADGSCKIEQGEWLVAIADYTADPPKLTTPQIQQIAAHRG